MPVRSLLCSVLILCVAAGPALAKDGDGRKSVTGNCTGSATTKLKVKPDNGRLETEFEVDQNRNGVKWTVTIKRNGTTVVKTSAKTSGPSGSFSIQRRLSDGAGADTISARAKNSSGQLCTASLRI